jgi:hypothetical protein
MKIRYTIIAELEVEKENYPDEYDDKQIVKLEEELFDPILIYDGIKSVKVKLLK